jgi:5-methylcytosine-specific restriction endonuclease McrA
MYRGPETHSFNAPQPLPPHDSLQNYPALILNADYRPLSYFPLSIWSWQDAIKAVFRDAVTVVSEYDRIVQSPSMDFKLPSVLALKEYIKPNDNPAFTRFNVFLRDEWHCQYCNGHFKTSELTFDHVVPRCMGGRTNWDNIVAACRICNTVKGHKLPKECGMHPIHQPQQPTIYELQEKGRKFPPNFLHESWDDFLYWDSELLDI